jgi:DNA-directed RNA polymerase delta subunit
MSDSEQGQEAYSAVIADLKSKRDQIDAVIATLEALRGGAVNTALGPVANTGEHNGVTETAGMYLGMSIADAAKKLLAVRKRTLGNAEIARELQAGGLVLKSKDPLNVVGSVLTRRFNDVGDVVKVGRGIWGLKEWYPGRTFKTSKSAGDGERQAEPQSVAETEQEAAQRVMDEMDRERAANAEEMF